MDEENLAIIKRLTEAADVCTMVFEGSKKWEDLLKQMSFFEDFDYFVGVSVKARNEAQMSSLNFKRMNVQHVTYLTYVTYITYHLLLFFTPTFLKDYLLLLQEETKAAPAEAKNVMI